MREVDAYSVLAAGYDLVMAHVDYPGWAAYVHELLSAYAPDATTVLELGCGTGSLGIELARISEYRYAGTDLVEQMVRVARLKAEREGLDLPFSQADFTNFALDRPVDAILLLYDGLNYTVELAALSNLFACAFEALVPGGVFIFDQSTPANSIRNQEYFEDHGEEGGFAYRRFSSYDSETRIHTTRFELAFEGHEFEEEHYQRAYDLGEIRAVVEDAGLIVEGVFDGFTREEADAESERAHWVVRRPA